eukprot:jgi/Astpho2/1746/fgenesh1_pg.00032_%23_73_t
MHVRCILLLLLLGLGANVSCGHAPVILVPGLGGSVLEAKTNRTSDEVPHYYCTLAHDWEVEWLSLVAASRPDCFLSELNITYSPGERLYKNASGVEIRPYDYGGLGGVYDIDPGVSLTGIYSTLIDHLKSAGYIERQDLFGAPYDFRLAADGLTQVGTFDNMTSLIEEAVKKNDGRKAMLVAHSMGSLVSLYFLDHKNADWLHKYVAGFVAISAPWEGSVKALKGSISGDNFDISGVPHGLLRPIQSKAPSAPWLFPTPDIWGDKVLVETASGDKYRGTAEDIKRLLSDLDLKQQEAVYEVTRNLTYPVPQLDLPVWCLFGEDVDTDEGYVYDIEHFDSTAPPAPTKIQQGKGDGTVNQLSLEACSKLGQQAEDNMRRFKGVEHTEAVSNTDVLNTLLDILKANADTGTWLQHSLQQLMNRASLRKQHPFAQSRMVWTPWARSQQPSAPTGTMAEPADMENQYVDDEEAMEEKERKPTPVTPPRPKKKSEQVGGAFNYAITVIWLVLAWCGWAIIVAGLSSLQNYTNRSHSSNQPNSRTPPNNADPQDSGWALIANYPYLPRSQVFRLDWFITFADFCFLCLLSFAMCRRALRVMRPTIVGYLIAGAVLSTFSADRFYNISHFVHGSNYSAARATFAGFVAGSLVLVAAMLAHTIANFSDLTLQQQDLSSPLLAEQILLLPVSLLLMVALLQQLLLLGDLLLLLGNQQPQAVEAQSKNFKEMMDAIASYGAGYQPPSAEQLSLHLLVEAVDNVDKELAYLRATVRQYGSAITCNGWSDTCMRPFLNMLQIPELTWMPYTSHVLDLFLEDVGRQKWADELFALAKQIAKFIYAQHKSPAIFPAKSHRGLIALAGDAVSAMRPWQFCDQYGAETVTLRNLADRVLSKVSRTQT